MNKDYYQDYYLLERSHWWFKVREKIISSRIWTLLPVGRKLKVLNVGAALGKTSEMLQEFGEVSSIEFDKDCCEFAKSIGIDVMQGSILELPFDNNTFDLVCAFDVIEHVEDDVKAVDELVRVCKPGGQVFVTVPAFMSLWSHHDVVNQHHRRYVMDGIIKLFSRHKTEGAEKYKTYFNSLLFLPIYVFRQFSRIAPSFIKRRDAGSDFSVVDSKSVMNKIFYSIFSIELSLLKFMRFPFGISILYAWQKKADHKTSL